MSNVDLSSTAVDGYQTLVCPSCGCENLHQGTVEVFSRPEDATHGAHAVVRGNKVMVDSDQALNPSSRRDGIRVSFSCEQCEAHPTLTIIQHKGNTFVTWERTF